MLRRPGRGLRMRKPGYLLEWFLRQGLQVRAFRRLLTQKYGCGSIWLPRFLLFGAVQVVSPLTRLLQIALQKASCVTPKGEVVRLPFFFLSFAAVFAAAFC